MDYDTLLDEVVRSVDGMIEKIDKNVRADFKDYTDYLDIFVDSLRSTDREDYLNLISQLQYMGMVLHDAATKCTCDKIRWHSCLSQLDAIFRSTARDCNVKVFKMVCEERGIPFENLEFPTTHSALSEDGIDFTVPDFIPEDLTNNE